MAKVHRPRLSHLGRFRLSATTNAAPLKADPLTAAQRQLLAMPPTTHAGPAARTVQRVFAMNSSFAKLNAKIDALDELGLRPDNPGACSNAPNHESTRIFKRGDWQRPGRTQSSRTCPMFCTPCRRTRRAIASASRNGSWIARAPTTARVIVNRVWQAYFGQGLFTTPEDIGTRCDAPSHPELLDWLAVEFMEPTAGFEVRSEKGEGTNADHPSYLSPRPWSFKHLHRLIVTSPPTSKAAG